MRPTARQVQARAHCSWCHTAPRGGTIKRTREVIELIPARVETADHQYPERCCPRCRGRGLPGSERDGVVVGQRRLGVELLSLIAVLREARRLPIECPGVVSGDGAWPDAQGRGHGRGVAADRRHSRPRGDRQAGEHPRQSGAAWRSRRRAPGAVDGGGQPAPAGGGAPSRTIDAPATTRPKVHRYGGWGRGSWRGNPGSGGR